MLGSIPLCAAELASGKLVLLENAALEHHETYWIIADKDAVSRAQWDAIAAVV